jgi:cytochrome c551/c552
MNAIITFLKSGEKAVKAVRKEDKPCEPSFLTKFLCNATFKPFPYPDHKIVMPDTNNKKEWGKYLAFNLECFSCHSADFKTNDFLNPEKSKAYFGGGNMMMNMEGEKIYTSNITPHKKYGIGAWSEAEFIKAVKYGIKEGEPALRYPMQPYIYMSDSEISAIYQYLQTIEPIENEVKRPEL